MHESPASDPGAGSLSRWWGRPAGGRDVLRVAAPLVVSTMSWTLLNFIDRVFLKWHSGDAMAAAFSASATWFSFVCLPLGICSYVNAFVAQYFGDGQLRRIGPAAWQGVYVAVFALPLMAVAYAAAPYLFDWAKHAPEIQDLEVRYFRILCFGGAGMWVCASLCCVYSGCGRTSVNMWIDAAFAAVNAALDYAWIFGEWGFPAWGIEGAAWATTVSLWLKAAFYVALMFLPRNRRELGCGNFGLNRELLGRLLRFGGPSGAQMVLEVAGFTTFIMLTGRLGPVAAEATALAFSVNMVAFMPIWGFAMAACILVGQHLGENRDDLADRTTRTTLLLACSYGLAVSTLYVCVPGWFLDPFFAGAEPWSAAACQSLAAAPARCVPLVVAPDTALLSAAVASQASDSTYALASRLLWFVAAYTLLDAVQITYVHAMKGAGDTRYIMLTSLTMALLLGVCTWLAVAIFQASLFACWGVISAWIAALAVVYWRRYRGGAWRQMRVIDAVHAADP